MSADESAMLDTLRKSLNISAEEHLEIEKDVRIELSGGVTPPEYEVANQQPSGTQQDQDMAMEQPAQAENEVAAVPTDENDIKALLNAGKESYHKGNYEEAIEYCDKVLLLDPDNSEALFFRKRTLSKIEKLHGKKGAGGKKAKADASAEAASGAAIEEATGGAEVETGPPPSQEPTPSAGTAEGGGDPNCKSCKGSGQCHWCRGSGQCYWCKGSGKCDKCAGTGKIGDEECKSCKGSGKCHSCNGDGKCYWCNGSGKCSKCG